MIEMIRCKINFQKPFGLHRFPVMHRRSPFWLNAFYCEGHIINKHPAVLYLRENLHVTNFTVYINIKHKIEDAICCILFHINVSPDHFMKVWKKCFITSRKMCRLGINNLLVYLLLCTLGGSPAETDDK